MLTQEPSESSLSGASAAAAALTLGLQTLAAWFLLPRKVVFGTLSSRHGRSLRGYRCRGCMLKCAVTLVCYAKTRTNEPCQII